ncbi:MAG: P-loop NTPase fold protein [Chitinophagaceae bacterium]
MAKFAQPITYVFTGIGDREINDAIYPGDPFPLKGQTYRFVLHPRTDYWRFGLRFSRNSTVEFSPEIRHGFKNQPDFQIVVGDRPQTNIWLHPEKLEISQYQYSEAKREVEQTIFKTFESYQSKGNVSLDIHHDTINAELIIHINAQGIAPTHIQVPVAGYSFFQLFAWSDLQDFEIESEIYRGADTELEKNSFSINNITFLFGDLFKDASLKNVDIVVLPVSTEGTVQSAITSKVKELHIEKPTKGTAGDVRILPQNNGIRFAWAYSVVGTEGSSTKILRTVCTNIRENAKNFKAKIVSLPLLATGAGRLNFKHVAKTYIDQFKKDTGKVEYLVYVNVIGWFNELVEEYSKVHLAATELSQNLILFRKRRFLFKDKHNIDPVLNVTDVAEELSELIQKLPEKEQEGMIGIFGKWGRGKTFLLKETWKILEQTKSYDKIEFHAWKYQDTPAIWGYLYELFKDSYYQQAKGWWEGVCRRLRLNYYRLGSWKIWNVIIPLLISIIIALIPIAYKISIIAALFSYGLISFIIIYYRNRKTVSALFTEYNKKMSFKHFLGAQAEIQQELKSLLHIWTTHFQGKKIVLVVEDIDRCDENKIIQIIDSLRVILEDIEISKWLTVLVSIDERILQMAIHKKYQSLTEASGSSIDLNMLVKEYFDKLFILGIRLGELSARERDEFFIELSKEERQDVNVKRFDDILVSKRKVEESESVNINTPAVVTSPEKIEVTDTIRLSDTIEISLNDKVYHKGHEQLSAPEFELLRKSLLETPALTPRQTRIFFYRFMIARNLLAKQYLKTGRNNVWEIEENYQYFIQLLIRYSLKEGRSKLTEEKLRVLNNTKNETVKPKQTKVDNDDYKEILKILDLVIAY